MQITFFTFFLTIQLALIADELSLEEKVGQLFIVGAYSSSDDAKKEELYEHPTRYVEFLIERYHIGGVLFKMRWNPQQLKAKSSHFQRLSKTPLFMCLDAEWGLGQRMPEGEIFPKNYALGSLDQIELVYQTGREIGRQCREIGINVNFAPVVDINTNPSNPIINHRSFGSNPESVAVCGVAMMKGLQEGGVLACAKHFPGHGDTSVDSHTGLPMIGYSITRLESVEFVPFKKLIEEGIDCVMGAHLLVPVLDPLLPTSLSPKAISGLLKDKMGFKGLAITDDLIMGAITNHYSLEESVVLSFQAGNDLILLSRDVEKGIHAIVSAVKNGIILLEDIEYRLEKINDYKSRISDHQPTCPDKTLQEKLYGSLVKVIRGDCPLIKPDFILQIGGQGNTKYFQSKIPCKYCFKDSTEKEITDLLKQFEETKSVAVVIFEMEPTIHTNFGIQKETLDLVQMLAQAGKDVTVILHGDHVAMQLMPVEVSIIGAYDENIESQTASLRLLID